MTTCHRLIAEKSTVLIRMSLMLLFLLCTGMVSAQQVEVTLTEAGTLWEMIPSDIKRYEITSLKVSGPINGTDIESLRKMAGKTPYGNNTSGKLADLDLTDANVVKGGDYYYYADFACYYTDDNVLGDYTFTGCILKSIKLPSSVTSIGKHAFCDCASLTSVIIPNSVINIGNSAFNSCTSLTSLTIPNSVTKIGDDAFHTCSHLDTINIPNSVTSIGKSVFSNCSNLTSINISNSVKDIDESMFENCTSLASVTIPNSVTNIGNGAFRGCSSLVSATIGNSVTSIGDVAFFNCTGLSSVTFPGSVKSIGAYAFENCSSLPSITIPASVTNIGYWAFQGCKNVKTLIFEDGDSILKLGNLCMPKDSINKLYLGRTFSGYNIYFGENLKEVTIGQKVTALTDNIFSNCLSLDSIFIPKSVTNIRSWAFYGCKNVKTLILEDGDSVLNLDGTYCLPPYVQKLHLGRNLSGTTPEFEQWVKELIIGTGVTTIKDENFTNYSSLTTVSIPNSVTSIGKLAFKGCSNLTAVMIPNSVKSIGYSAFEGCTSLASANLPDSLTIISSSIFSGCSKLNSIVIPNSVTSIGYQAFYNCNLRSVTIPNTVTKITTEAFKGCSGGTWIFEDGDSILYLSNQSMSNHIEKLYLGRNLTESSQCRFGEYLEEVTVGPKVTFLGDNIFSRCKSLHSITIPNSVTSIGNFAFYNCYNLTNANIPNSVTSIGDYAFQKCYSLYTINIPNSVTSIGSWAFRDCSKVQTLTIEDGDSILFLGESCLPTIGSWDLYLGRNLSGPMPHFSFGLTNATIGSNITSIKDKLFSDCSELRSVTILNSVTSIGDSAFFRCHALDSITIPSSVTSIGNYAFSGCNSLKKMKSLSTIPPVCGYMALDDINKERCKLYVPANSFSAYQVADQWKDFFIVKITPTGIIQPCIDEPNEVVRRYDSNGRQMDKPFKGLNILKMSNGTTRKVMVK